MIFLFPVRFIEDRSVLSVYAFGRPIACLRISQADARERHRGVSHYSLIAYGRVALAGADVVVPRLGGELGRRVDAQARRLCEPRAVGARHRRVDADVERRVFVERLPMSSR